MTSTRLAKEPKWTPLGKKCPAHWVPGEQGRRVLSAGQRRFIKRLLALREEGTPQAATLGLALLDTIPSREEQILDLVTFRAEFLRLTEKPHLADGVLFDHLFSMENEALWLHRGNLFLEWFSINPRGDARAQVIGALRGLCARSHFLAPRLVLAFALSQDEERPPTEARELYAEVLKPERWRKHRKRMAPWVEQLAGGFFSYIDLLCSRGELDKARSYGKMIPRFAWEACPQTFSQNALHLLCLSLLQLESWEEQDKLCVRMQRKFPRWGEPHFWLGRSALREGNTEQMVSHFRKAIRFGGIEDKQKLSIARALLATQHHDDVRKLLAQIEEKEQDEYLHLKALYALYQEELEEALEICLTILERTPDDQVARLHASSILEGLGRLEEAEALLRPALGQGGLVLRLLAHLFLGELCLQTGRPEEALDFFRALQQPPFAQQPVFRGVWRQTFLASLGECLEQLGQAQEAIAAYQEALSLYLSAAVCERVALLLLGAGRYAEVREVLQAFEESRADDALTPWLLYAKLQVAAYEDEWEECQRCLDALALSWFQEQELLAQGLLLSIRTTFACGGPWQALTFCEAWLEDIWQDETLKALRAQVFAAAQDEVEAMQDRLVEQGQKLRALEEKHRTLHHKIDESRKREETFARILQRQQASGRSLRSSGRREQLLQVPLWQEPPLHRSQHQRAPSDDRLEGLSSASQEILANATLLWTQLAAHSEQDHGPVIMQLARVVEAEVNQRLLKPLLSLATTLAIPLEQLPSPALGSLSNEHHRTSLGDAAALLYHRLQQGESDGSITTLRNPRSNEHHRELLQRFWTQPPLCSLPPGTLRYLQEQLPLDLQTLSRARNRVSHANSPQDTPTILPRAEASTIRTLVLGDADQDGILPLLATIPLPRG